MCHDLLISSYDKVNNKVGKLLIDLTMDICLDMSIIFPRYCLLDHLLISKLQYIRCKTLDLIRHT